MRLQATFLLLTALLAAGCGEAVTSGGGESTTRDSAGIAIVDNVSPEWAAGRGLSVRQRPTIEIGVAQGDTLYELANVRSAWRLADGRIAVADEGAHQVRFYGPDGKFIVAAGRQGEGPGEFGYMWHVRPFGPDSLMVYDYSQQRVAILDNAGRFGRSVPVMVDRRNYWAVGSLRDSLIVLVSPGEGTDRNATPGFARDSTYAFLYRGPDLPMDTIGRFPLAMRYRSPAGPQLYYFLPRSVFAFSGERFFFGSSDAWEVRELTADGRTVRIIRVRRMPEPLDAERLARFKQEYLTQVMTQEGSVEGSSEQFRRALNDAFYPEIMPAYSNLMVDSEGWLWVEQYRLPNEAESHWTVFDAEGRWLTDVRMPDGLAVEQIGRDFVLGLNTDADGVQRVRVYTLERQGLR